MKTTNLVEMLCGVFLCVWSDRNDEVELVRWKFGIQAETTEICQVFWLVFSRRLVWCLRQCFCRNFSCVSRTFFPKTAEPWAAKPDFDRKSFCPSMPTLMSKIAPVSTETSQIPCPLTPFEMIVWRQIRAVHLVQSAGCGHSGSPKSGVQFMWLSRTTGGRETAQQIEPNQ